MRVELIAEVASNHGGSLDLAKEFIHRFADAGADWIKFQTTRVKHLRPDDPQYAWFKQAELSDEAHVELKAECESAGVRFLTTVYNAAEVSFLASLGLEAIKIGSGEAHEPSLAEAVQASKFRRVIVATGLSSAWASPFLFLGCWRVQFLRCATKYPCPVAAATHRYGRRLTSADVMGDDELLQPRTVGWSDHCVGLEGAATAIACGAGIIEKHVQLPNQARACQPWEATVEEFRQLRKFADDDPTRFLGRWQAA